MADISDLRIDRSIGHESTRDHWRTAFLALLLCVVVAGLIVGYAWHSQSHTAAAERTTMDEVPTRSLSANQSAATTFTAAGYVEVVPPGARIIAPLVRGRVQDILVREGQSIRRGDLIATLDTSLLEQESRRAEADLVVLHARLARLKSGYLPDEIEQSESRVVAAQSALQFASDHLQRQMQLAEAGAVPRRAVLEAEAEVTRASALLLEAEADLRIKQLGARPEDLAIARAEIAHAEVVYDRLRWEIEQCAVRSPIDGIVFQQFAQPGQWISPDDAGSAGAIVSVFTPGAGALQAWVDVNQRDINRVRPGQRVTMVADAAADVVVDGEVIQIMPRASIERNTIRVKISIEDEHEHLRPDMSLRVSFHD